MSDNSKQSTELQLASASPAENTARATLPEKIDMQFMPDAAGKPAMSMHGFNPRYADFVDYIIGITHEIWEERGIGKLYDYYANTVKLHTANGLVYGREAVFASTIAALAAYPDRRLYGDEVIWGGDDQVGLYSSHRLMHEGTNRGWSLYGAPTGKRVRYAAIADCLCLRNMVVEEWLVRDELSHVLQLGLDPVATAAEMVAKERDSDFQSTVAGDVERGWGQLPPPEWESSDSDTFDPEDFIGRMFHEIWNWRLLNKAREFYHENFAFEGATRRSFLGLNDFHSYALGLLAPFPDLAIQTDHFCHVGDAESGWRVATRWTMRGTHTGYGVYGEPTGNPVRLMGISHHLIQDGRISHEWTIFDEFALLKQIGA